VKYPERKTLNYAQVANEVRTFWQEHQVFEKSVSQRQGQQTFTFFEGPPSANGTPGIHHVMARTVKDLFCRYKTQKGFQVKRKGGWDTHGLPVELQVEKELGIIKDDIGKKISIEEYNAHCRKAVMKYKGQWDELTRQMGYWVDLENPYVTFDTNYIETVWHLLKSLHEKNLLYKGYTIQPYSPAAGTGLSSHELNQPGAYRTVKDTSITAQFKLKGEDNVYMLAWTTTPWTLPANSALAVGKNIDYVKVATFNPYTHKPVNVILAKNRLYSYLNKKQEGKDLSAYKPGDKGIPWQITEQFKGADLVGKAYEQLLPYVPLEHPAFTVVAGDFVTTEDGTGVVHLAKTFGSDDFMTLEKQGIPAIMVKDEEGNDAPIVDKRGRFVKEITDFAGMYVKNYEGKDEGDPNYKSTDVLIAIKLKEENKAFKVEKYEHSYPHCWRTDKPILYYPLASWFVKTTAYKDELIAQNKTINWKPESTGSGRFGNWLENMVDWNLSRDRYWGTPLPIWRTEDGKQEKCIGSIAELRQEVDQAVKAGFMKAPLGDDIDLHRPYVDDIVLVSADGQPMHREKALIDVWFDSGAMPYAQWHYPFENQQGFEQSFPADFIAEGVDQTRGWFYTLHTLGVMLFGKVAYKNVIANGLVLDSQGNKMSKSRGNAVNPFETIDKYGPDATRWYMITNANPWDNLKFDTEGVEEVQRRFFGTLHNTYNFFALYANLDSFDYSAAQVPLEQRDETDRWIISKLNSLIKVADQAFEAYEPTRAGRAIQDFVTNDLSNWYVRLNRKRYWRTENAEGAQTDKLAAYQTLYQCLNTVARLMAPIAPFYAEQLYHDLQGGRTGFYSVHIDLFPEAEEAHIDAELEERMKLAQDISSLVHSLRRKHKLKVRQPLSRILVPVLDDHFGQQVQAIEAMVCNEVNVKAVEYLKDTSGVIVKKAKPNFPRLGKKYGPKMKSITNAVKAWGQAEIAQLESNGTFELGLDNESIVLERADVDITSEDIPGWTVAIEGKLTVALDITVTDNLRKEGIARDLVNRVQNLRKDMGLEVQDKISIKVQKNDELVQAALQANKEYICRETQALSLDFEDHLQNGKVLEMDDLQVVVEIDV